LNSIRKKNLADSIIKEIKRMIEYGELKEGQKLPNQNEFAAQLGVSRSSLREALHVLTVVGGIEQRPGVGTIIKSANSASWAEHLSTPIISDSMASRELIEARRFIEIGTVELASRRATATDIRKIGDLAEKMTCALKDKKMDEFSSLDMQFHYQIAESSHNRYMLHLFINIQNLLRHFIHDALEVIPGLREKQLKFHIRIFQGIRDRDMRKATRSMRTLLNNTEVALKQYHDTSSQSKRGE
jgi:GntR family transcriptional repressor for pyruvate dehydrogenase complex